MNIIHKNKYLKYKKKYLDLKKKINSLKGGATEDSDKVLSYSEKINALDYSSFKNLLTNHIKSNKTNNLLIVFYAHWCGFCNSFLESADYINLEKNGSIFAINADYYDSDLQNIGIPKVEAYPTIYKFTKIKTQEDFDNFSNNNISEYFKLTAAGDNIGRTPKELMEFLNSSESSE